MPRLLAILALFYWLSLSAQAADFPIKSLNGFDLKDTLIDAGQISRGGPPRDGIPALTHPAFITAEQAGYLKPDDRILGFSHNGVHKAYPIRLMNWHEIVNDRVGGMDVVITYCPLCGTGMAFDAKHNNQTLEFGVSGLLYNSDVLLYDRHSESLWSQIMMKAISGPHKGQRLSLLPMTHTTWTDWTKQHPDTRVLSQDTGYSRDYSQNPYQGYEQSAGLYFRVSHTAPNWLHSKERVIGIQVGDHFKAYAFSELEKSGLKLIEDQFKEKVIRIRWDQDNQRAQLLDDHNKPLPAFEGFWFAWYTFHPETEVYRAKPTVSSN